eukprot:1161047-Pelagomonas_calceolata.AAC.44
MACAKDLKKKEPERCTPPQPLGVPVHYNCAHNILGWCAEKEQKKKTERCMPPRPPDCRQNTTVCTSFLMAHLENSTDN